MDDSQKPKYEYKVNPEHKIMIETEFRKLPNEILTDKALHELKFVACKPMVTIVGTKNPGFQIDTKQELLNYKYRTQELRSSPKPTLIVEDLRPMADIYSEIEERSKYLPGHYHNYLGQNKIYPQPFNDGTIKAFFPDPHDTPVFPETKLRQLYSDQEKVEMAKEIERKQNLSKPVLRFKKNVLSFSHFNAYDYNDDNTTINSHINSDNNSDINNEKKKNTKKIRYFDSTDKHKIINNTISKLPNVINSTVDGKKENDIILRWNYLTPDELASNYSSCHATRSINIDPLSNPDKVTINIPMAKHRKVKGLKFHLKNDVKLNIISRHQQKARSAFHKEQKDLQEANRKALDSVSLDE